MEWIPAANYTPTNGRKVDLIVIHTMEAPEKGQTAESVAKYFQRSSVKASAHYCIDNDSMVQCVKDKDVAWAAPGANHNGVQFEHAGYAGQKTPEWYDEYSRSMLRKSASLAAAKVKSYGLPVRFVSAADLRAGGARARGITTHWEATQAFRKSDHTDPGRDFPMTDYLRLIHRELGTTDTGKGNVNRGEMKEFDDAVDACLIPGWHAPDGRPGSWILRPDGGVFTHPENVGAPFYGSMGGKPLNGPMSGIVSYKGPGGELGYWTIAQDGGIFAFGAAPGVVPYDKFFHEYTVGAHSMIDAEFDGHVLTCIADDGACYQYAVA